MKDTFQVEDKSLRQVKHRKTRIILSVVFIVASLISGYFVVSQLNRSGATAALLGQIGVTVSDRATGPSGPTDGYGLYDSCTVDQQSCQDHLQVMANAGFHLVVNYNQLYASADNEIAYARLAASHGMKVIWSLGDIANLYNKDLRTQYPDLAATCNCNDNAGFIRYFVNLVKNLPGTWGYYIADEAPASQHAQVKMIADMVHQADPNHPRLLVLGSDGPFLNDGIKTYADTADVLAQDYYPVGDPNESLNGTATVAKQVQSVADSSGKQSGMVLQAHSLGEYEGYANYCSPFPSCLSYPTTDQMKSMINLTLQASHPRVVLWYSYFDLINSGNYMQHWNNLVSAVKAAPVMPQSTPTSAPKPTNTAQPKPTKVVPSGGPAGGSDPGTVVPTTGLSLYDEGLQNSWLDWSWDSTTDPADTSHPYTGQHAFAWTPKNAYAGIFLKSPSAISTAGKTNLTFAIRASAANQQFVLSLLDQSEQALHVVRVDSYGGSTTAGAYKVYTIPLSALHATKTDIWGIEIINETETTQPTIYVDAVALQ